MLFRTTCDSPVGRLFIASDGRSVTGLWMEGQKYFAATLKETPEERDDLPVFAAAKNWLDRYFSAGTSAGFPLPGELPLAPAGSVFRRQVFRKLCAIPAGETTTYGAIAAALAAETGKPHISAQAVGGAVGHNPISIVIPCHRVVGADGSLTGYAGGLDKKIALLLLEGVSMERLYRPKRGTAL